MNLNENIRRILREMALGVPPQFIEKWVDLYLEIIIEVIKKSYDELQDVNNRNHIAKQIGGVLIKKRATKKGMYDNTEFSILPPTLMLEAVLLDDDEFNKLGGKVIYDASVGGGDMLIGHDISDANGNSVFDPSDPRGDIEYLIVQQTQFRLIFPMSMKIEEVDDYCKGIRTVLMHEFTHIYEDYRRGTSKRQEYHHNSIEQRLNTVQQTSPVIAPEWGEFLFLMYFQLSFERRAKIPEVYEEMKQKGITSKEQFKEYLKNGHFGKTLNKLRNFNAETIYKSIGRDNLQELISQIQVVMKAYKDQNQSEIMALQIIGILPTYEPEKYKYDFPQSHVQNPLKFLKFWEKKFHAAAEDLYRRAARLLVLLK